ncbi:ABC transporter permease [Rhizobium alvei]|uniref:ABC transporter permease n=1 Tax=Rhizobium alvei TaxID=1132659 RepID=A0ABT8YHS2_9HYPH|nr:ABC transporter permease [Rhizobium alvei]MDO6962977.1 ABC transporter permease [Rhizobium alvei]
MAVLDRKLMRDLWRMRVQVLAIALVMACGVATIVTALGAHRSLLETRSAFYDRYRFANVFATVTRAPDEIGDRLAAVSGVGGMELRIVKAAILDIEGMAEPAAGVAVSIPDRGEPAVNRLYLRAGRLPDASREGEIAVVENFAKAHRMEIGSRFRAIMNGRKRLLTVTGIVLSPEYIYSIGPGDMVPDQRRFGVFFMPKSALAGIFDMQGAFNDVALRVLRGASVQTVIDQLDAILKPYGGTGAYERTDQVSHSFLDNELVQLRAMATVIPPVFLFVAAFLVNMILSRLIALEREQIGLLKAVGYSDLMIAWHYVKFTIVIALVGLLIGSVAGNWLGRAMTRLYTEFFAFPFLIFLQSADLYLIAAGVTVAAAIAGALRSILSVVALPAAVAMKPPAPTRFRSLFGGRGLALRMFSQLTIMAARNMIRWPLRTVTTIFGTSLSVALLVTALFSFDSIAYMIDTVFFRAERQDAILSFATARTPDALDALKRLPGVMKAEPYRAVSVIMRRGQHERRLAISAIAEGGDLAQILDTDLRAVTPPSTGLMVSERVAAIFELGIGDPVEITVPELGNRRFSVPVTAVVQSFVGLSVYMDGNALSALLGEGPRISGARISIDRQKLPDLYAAVKNTPAIASIALLGISRERFRETISQNITMMTTVYSVLAIIITFGVIYNSARITLSEQARELASLRVLGFTRMEVSSVLLVELFTIVLVAQPAGWLIGSLFARAMVKGFESDLFRIPFIINNSTYAIASAIVLTAGLFSALIVRRRIDRLDLVSVLKTRE